MTKRSEWAAITGITAMAVVCRLTVLWQPMRFDEAVSWAYYVGRSWWTIIATYTHPNNHVFYSLLAKLSAAAMGYPPWALRLPAFIAGVAIVPLIWAVGRRFADSQTALLAAALSVGSTQLMLYSTNARGYSLVVALFLVMLLVADRIQRTTGAAPADAGTRSLRSGRQGVSLWVFFTMLGAIGLYTIPIMLYPMGIAAVWLALCSRRLDAFARRRFLVRLACAVVAAMAIAGILYLPIIRTAGLAALLGNKWVTPSPWPVFLEELPGNLASTLASWTSPLPWWSTPLVTLIALAGIRASEKLDRAPLALAAGIWCTALLIATHRAPFIRVWLFLLPLFLLSVARGALTLVRRARRTVEFGAWPAMAVAALSLGVAVTTRATAENDDTGTYRHAEEVTALLEPRLRAGDRVLAPIPAIGPLLYYFPRAGADTAMLTIPVQRSLRAFLVLDTRSGQTLDWVVQNRMLNPEEFEQPKLLMKYTDAEVWEAARRK